MPTILVPYHHDEPLPADTFPLPGPAPVLVAPALPPGDVWQRLSALYDVAADAVATAVAADGNATVVSGDCLMSLATLAGVQRAGLDEPAEA